MKKTNRLKFLFEPKSIAVIGASRSPKKIGHLIFKNIIDNGFRGRVFPINPKAEKILNRPAYSSIVDIPQPVDLAIIVIPAPAVAPVLEQAAKKGVGAAIIISAGFGESGPLGQKKEEEIKKITHDVIYLPKIKEPLMPILAIIPLQLLAYYLGVSLGYDVDKPRNLAKSVTVE